MSISDPTKTPHRFTLAQRTATGLFCIATLVIVARLGRAAAAGQLIVPDWQAGQFWIDYSGGFIRRGLPGELIAILNGGPPSATQVAAAGTILVVAALAAWSLLTAEIVKNTPKNARILSASLMVASPFSFSLTISDFARYDTIGTIASAAILLLSRSNSPILVATGGAITVSFATASEEFLLLFLMPLLWIATRSAGARSPTLLTATSLLPAAIIAMVSVFHRPPSTTLWEAAGRAHGHRGGILADGSNSAIGVIPQSALAALERLGAMPWWVIPIASLLFGGLFFGTSWLLWRCIGTPERSIVYIILIWGTGAAISLSLIAIDYRRWWALAFLLIVAALPLLKRQHQHGNTVRVTSTTVLAVALLLVAQFTPLGAERIAPAFATNTPLPIAAQP